MSTATPRAEAEPAAFIPVTRQALLNRLANTVSEGGPEQVAACLRALRLLCLWRHEAYRRRLGELRRAYLPFSPDRDTRRVLKFDAAEREALQRRLLDGLEALLRQAHYRRLTAADLDAILNEHSPYGLALQVDLSEYEEILLYYRGATEETRTRRSLRSLYLREESYTVPIYQRLFLLLKLKPRAQRIAELMRDEGLDRQRAERRLDKLRASLPDRIQDDFIYLKLFRFIPRADLEMLFPNTRVRLRPFDKLKLGVTAGGGTVGGVVATATKVAAASNPLTAAGALAGLAGVIFRQVSKIISQRNKYMMVLARNLYFHNLAGNRAALTLLVDRAEEEEVKAAMLLYHFLRQHGPGPLDPERLGRVIETWLEGEFGVRVRFDTERALAALVADGLVEYGDGVLHRVADCEAAAEHLRRRWEALLDEQERGPGAPWECDSGEV